MYKYKIQFGNRDSMWKFQLAMKLGNYKASNVTLVLETSNFSVLEFIHSYNGELL